VTKKPKEKVCHVSISTETKNSKRIYEKQKGNQKNKMAENMQQALQMATTKFSVGYLADIFK
jgi:hypothetical protein